MKNATSDQLRYVLFVLNPVSGDIDKSRLTNTVAAYCTGRGRQVAFFYTTGENDLVRLRGELATTPLEAVFAAGGDGTVSLVAEAVAGTAVPVGILPLGSGNGLAKDLGIPLELEPALALSWQHRVRVLDTLRVGGRFAVHLADMGFNARVVDRFHRGDGRGPTAYMRIATAEYAAYQPATYHIETDRETWRGAAFMLTMANANTFGSNIVINPGSELDDGQFEICLITPFPATAAPALLYHLYTSGFDASGYTRRLRCRWARIAVAGATRALVQIDGEPHQLPTPVMVEIWPRSLRVLVPAATPAPVGT